MKNIGIPKFYKIICAHLCDVIGSLVQTGIMNVNGGNLVNFGGTSLRNQILDLAGR